MHKVIKINGSNTEVNLCKDSAYFVGASNYFKICPNKYQGNGLGIEDKSGTEFYSKWALQDSLLILLFKDLSPFDGTKYDYRLLGLIRIDSSHSFEVSSFRFGSLSPLSLFFDGYNHDYLNYDSTKYIKFDITAPTTSDVYMAVSYPKVRMLSIWKYLNDSTYEYIPVGVGLYRNRVAWSFIDSVRVDSVTDFNMMKVPAGFLLSFADGQSYILHNSAKTDQRTLPKSAKFLFIQEEHQCTIMSVDANGNVVASTVYTW